MTAPAKPEKPDRLALARDALADSDVFGSLYEEDIEKLMPLGRLVHVPSGRMIFQKGDPGDCLMIVVSGRIRIGTVGLDGREVMLNLVETGEVFGEIGVLDGKHRSADAAALSDCELFVLDRARVMEFLEGHPHTAIRLIGILCERLRHSTELIEDTMLLGMEQRVAKTLLRIGRRYGIEKHGIVRIENGLSQRDLGSFAGLARENVNRQMRSFKERGLIEVDHGVIILKNVKALQAIATPTGPSVG
jgi:CRP-like cAMP-binding protein